MTQNNQTADAKMLIYTTVYTATRDIDHISTEISRAVLRLLNNKFPESSGILLA